MPFMLQADEFAERAFRTIAAGTSYRVIPWQMGVVAKLMRLLPNPLFDKLLAGRGRKKRRGEEALGARPLRSRRRVPRGGTARSARVCR